MGNIKISVVTICFDSKKNIEQTIRSVLGQSYGNVEYIIIDGGSTDGTLDIIKKYENKIAYWGSAPDRGIYDAMNKGVAKATGDVIGFINSDDWYTEGAIAAIANAFDETNADIVYGHYFEVMEGGPCRISQRGRLKDIYCGMVFGHPATFVKTKLLKEFPFDCSYKIVADYAFFLSMYLQGKRFYGIDAIIAYFRVGGISSHPWRTYIETKRASFRLTRGKVSAERYQIIYESFRKKRFFPILYFLKHKMQCMQRRKKEAFMHLCRSKTIILYGAGKLGRAVLYMLKEWGISVFAFWDSDATKQNTIVEGLQTLCPVYRGRLKGDIIIIITTLKDHGSIISQLELMGYQKKRDFWNSDEWLGWLAKVWVCGLCQHT